jgi:hypothetical protein
MARQEVRATVLYFANTKLPYFKQGGPEELRAPCPFHKGGMERTPSFSISLHTGRWFCHTCQEGGGLKKLFSLTGLNPDMVGDIEYIKKEKKKTTSIPMGILGLFDYCPLSLVRAGFDKEVIRKHDIGYDRRKGYSRTTFPMICMENKLRYISGRAYHDFGPRYKVYTQKDINDLIANDEDKLLDYEPDKNSYLWRENLLESKREIVIAEGFKAALWLAQHGYNSVALAGTYLSDKQALKLRLFEPSEIFMFLDNDSAGIKAVPKAVKKLINLGLPRIKVCRYPDGKDEPDALTKDEIDCAFSDAHTLGEFYRR